MMKHFGKTVTFAFAGLACVVSAGALLWPALAADKAETPIPIFSPTVTGGWVPDRPTGDDFLPPPNGGPGPVMSDPKHPYVPNGGGRQSTYRVADLTNPILKPWAAAQMQATNVEALKGYRQVPFAAQARCYPGGVPEAVTRQLDKELEVIADLDYAGYFLTMHEIVRFCAHKGILCQGRGSAANS